MNGWIRLGVVSSVTWICVVASFAAYEWRHLPVPNYLGQPSYADQQAASNAHLVYLHVGKAYELMPASERAEFLRLFDEAIQREKTDEGRQQRIAARDLITSWPALNWIAVLAFIAIPITLGWLLTLGAIATIRWVARGFTGTR